VGETNIFFKRTAETKHDLDHEDGDDDDDDDDEVYTAAPTTTCLCIAYF
jgi:hypothetical protein